MKLLGFSINNTGIMSEKMFRDAYGKIASIITSWSRYRLSLQGRIGIYKTLCLSQLSFPGSICTPSPTVLKNIQSLMSSFVVGNLRVANERLFRPPDQGGLNLINLKIFLIGLQAVWVKRAYESTRDNWRVELRNKCFGNPYIIGSNLLPVNECPLIENVVKSFETFRYAYYGMENNFLEAYIVNNSSIKRSANSALCLDENFFSGNRPWLDMETVSKLKLSDLMENGNFKTLDAIEDDIGIHLSLVTYLRLGEALHLYLNRNEVLPGKKSIGINLFLQKKGGEAKRVHKVMDAKEHKNRGLNDFTIYKTYCRLTSIEDQTFLHKSNVFGFWSRNFLCNKMRDFLFRYTNNQLPLNTRLSHFVQNNIRTCQLCIVAGNREAVDETFSHLFLECNVTKSTHNWFLRKYLPNHGFNMESKKMLFFGGCLPETEHFNKYAFLVAAVCQLLVWDMKVQKRFLAPLTLDFDFRYYIKNCVRLNGSLINDMARVGIVYNDSFP
jgi:hypothetical protein